MVRYFSRSWALIKYSLWVLNKDRELLVFPILSLLAAVGIAVISFFGFMPTFAVSAVIVHYWGPISGSLFITAYVMSCYVMLVFGIIFFNAALTGAVLIRLEGRNPTLTDGLKVAGKHIGQIFKWSILLALVGIIMHALFRNSGLVGRIISAVAGFVWALATFFVIPILVTQKNVRPFDAIRESQNLIKRTFGESLIGDAGVAACFILPYLAIALIVSDFSLIAAGESPYILYGPVFRYIFEIYAAEAYTFMLILFLITFVFHSTLFSIFRACLYQYIIDRNTNETAVAYGGDPYVTSLFGGTFREK